MKNWIYSLCTILLIQLPLMAQGDIDSPPARDAGIWQTASMIGIFLVFFYFILFRPEQKRRQEAEEKRRLIKKGDRVTAMGIIGTVVRVQDDTFILKMYDGSIIEVLKGAVTDHVEGSEDDVKKADKEDKALPKKNDSSDV
jgi:preprotein translocase subunit YajC